MTPKTELELVALKIRDEKRKMRANKTGYLTEEDVKRKYRLK